MTLDEFERIVAEVVESALWVAQRWLMYVAPGYAKEWRQVLKAANTMASLRDELTRWLMDPESSFRIGPEESIKFRHDWGDQITVTWPGGRRVLGPGQSMELVPTAPMFFDGPDDLLLIQADERIRLTVAHRTIIQLLGRLVPLGEGEEAQLRSARVNQSVRVKLRHWPTAERWMRRLAKLNSRSGMAALRRELAGMIRMAVHGPYAARGAAALHARAFAESALGKLLIDAGVIRLVPEAIPIEGVAGAYHVAPYRIITIAELTRWYVPRYLAVCCHCGDVAFDPDDSSLVRRVVYCRRCNEPWVTEHQVRRKKLHDMLGVLRLTENVTRREHRAGVRHACGRCYPAGLCACPVCARRSPKDRRAISRTAPKVGFWAYVRQRQEDGPYSEMLRQAA